MSRPLVFLLVLALCLGLAQASHFRSATYNWERTAANPLTVTFHIEQAWRWTAFGSPALNTVVGISSFTFGDNTATSFSLKVNAVNSAEDWFVGTTSITHTYPSASVYTFQYSDCCRIGGLQNGNSGLSEIQRNRVNLTAGAPLSSFKIGSLPIVFFQINALNTISIPYLSGNGPLPVTFSITAPADSALNTASPPGLSVSSGGVITWTPTTAGLYALSLTAQDGSNLAVLDFILQVAAGCGTNCANNPPAFVPTSPPSIVVTENTLAAQDIESVDPDGDAPDIFSSGLPNGASLSPCSRPAANRCIRSFAWVPPIGAPNTFVCFTTTDNKPNGNYIGQYCMFIQVVAAQQDTINPTSGTGGVTPVECASLGGAINNKQCFVSYTASGDYNAADLLCKAKAGKIAVFRDINDNNAARAAAAGFNVYIGLKRDSAADPLADASFQWVDGSTRSFSNWDATEPNNVAAPEECAVMVASGKWADVSCSTAARTLCQFDIIVRDVSSQECTTQAGTLGSNCAATCVNPTDCSRPLKTNCARNNTAEPAAPVFINNHTVSFLDAKTLQLTFESSYEFYYTSFAFVNASNTGYCDHSLFNPSTNWYDEATACSVKYVARFFPPKALAECFTKTTTTGKICYDAIILITTKQKRPSIRGTPLERIVVTAKRLRFCFPTLVTVSLVNNITVFGPQVVLRELTEQIFDPATETTRVRLFTSVQYPYKLTPATPGLLSSGVSPAGYSITPTVAANAGYSCPNSNNVCEQTWDVTVSQINTICKIEPVVTFNFIVICDPSYTGNCSAINPNTYSAQFTLASNDYCVQIVEDVQLSGSLTPYSVFPILPSSPADYNFIYNQLAYFAADVQADSGPGISSSRIESVSVTSAGNFNVAFDRTTILGANPNQYFYFDSVSTQPTRSYFGFQVNANTVALTDPDQPQTVGVTALVSVTYFNLVREYREVVMTVETGKMDLQESTSSQTLSLGANFGVTQKDPDTITPTPTPTAAASTASGSSSMVAIIAGVVAGVVVIGVIAGLAIRYRRAKNASTTTPKEVEMNKTVTLTI